MAGVLRRLSSDMDERSKHMAMRYVPDAPPPDRRYLRGEVRRVLSLTSRTFGGETRLWRESGGMLPSDRVTYRWVDTADMNAAVSKWNGWYVLWFHTGLVWSVTHVIFALAAHPDILPDPDGERQEPWTEPMDVFRQRTGGQRFLYLPRGERRRRLAWLMAQLAWRFYFYHEFAHALRGHVEIVSRLGLGLHLSESACGTNESLRFLEMDADKVAADLMIGVGSFDSIRRHVNEDEDSVAAFVFVIGICLILLDHDRGATIDQSVEDEHPFPLHRFFSAMDTSAGAFGNYESIDLDTATRGAGKAIKNLRIAARALGSPVHWGSP